MLQNCADRKGLGCGSDALLGVVEVPVRELSILERLSLLGARDLAQVLANVPESMLEDIAGSWQWRTRPSQLAPEGEWSQWLILAGRGFGKTRAGAEWVTERARATPGARFALVGVSAHDVASVMVEGESGLANAPAYAHFSYVGSLDSTWGPTAPS